MRKYGGGFVQSLAECLTRADQQNREKLVNTFPDEMKMYLNI
jgi:hypothetical protein